METSARVESLDLGKRNSKDYAVLSSCSWSSDGKRLVAQIPEFKKCVSYELAANMVKVYEKVEPLFSPGSVADLSGLSFMTSPIAPDASGFLALANSKLVLQPWDGEPKEFEMIGMDETTASNAQLLHFVAVWEEGQLRIVNGSNLILVNPVDLRCTLEAAPHLKRLVEHAQKHEVSVLAELTNGSVLQQTKAKRVQFWNAASETTIDIVQTKSDDSVIALPAPNGQAVLLYSFTGDPQIFAIDDQGKVMTKISFSEK